MLVFSLFHILYAAVSNELDQIVSSSTTTQEAKKNIINELKLTFGEVPVKKMLQVHEHLTEGLPENLKARFDIMSYEGALNTVYNIFTNDYWKKLKNPKPIYEILLPELYRVQCIENAIRGNFIQDVANELKDEQSLDLTELKKRYNINQLRLLVAIMCVKCLESNEKELSKVLLRGYKDMRKNSANDYFSVGDLFQLDWPYTIICSIDQYFPMGVRSMLFSLFDNAEGDFETFKKKSFAHGFDENNLKKVHRVLNNSHLNPFISSQEHHQPFHFMNDVTTGNSSSTV